MLSDIPANLDIGLAAHNYVRVGDKNALAAALQRPHADYRIDADAVRERFDWEKIARLTLAVYREAYQHEAAAPIAAKAGEAL